MHHAVVIRMVAMNTGSQSSGNPVGDIIESHPEALRGTNDDHGREEDHDHDQERPTKHTSLVAAISTDPGLTARQRRASPRSTPQRLRHNWSTEPAKQITKGIEPQQFESVDDYITHVPTRRTDCAPSGA